MTTVNDILSFLETIAPQAKKQSWDNVGLLCGRKNKEVNRILIALDPFEAVADEAIRRGADLILTHHPLIFHPVYSVTDETSVGRTLTKLLRNDISAINAHTNLDIAPGGVNDCLANTLGLQEIAVIEPEFTDSDGRDWGLLRSGTVETQELEAFLEHVKNALHCPHLRYAPGGKQVHKVAVGGGACADEFMSAVQAGCDTFVTSDVKYNVFWDARDIGLSIIDAGHFYTENPVCTFLYKTVQAEFPDVDVVISTDHHDCMKYY